MPQNIELTWLHDISASLETHDFVEGLLGNGTASVVYGEPNCGKTFFALELGLTVARGISFFEREVTQGGVIYCALEGGYGVRNRIAAYLRHHQIAPEDASRIPFAIVTTSLNLLDPEGDTLSLIHSIKGAAERIGEPVRLIIVDTLSRSMPGGNENSPEDMTGLISHIDLIRLETKAHTMMVHHCGKDTAKGLRGHSSLRGAIDTEIEVEKRTNGDASKPVTVAKVSKQRDLELAGEFPFRLKSVELGQNSRGKPVTSCIVEPEEYAPPAKAKRNNRRLPDTAALVLLSLRHVLAQSGKPAPASNHIPPSAYVVAEPDLRRECYLRNVSTDKLNSKCTAFSRGLDWLQTHGLAQGYAGSVWLTDDGKQHRL